MIMKILNRDDVMFMLPSWNIRTDVQYVRSPFKCRKCFDLSRHFYQHPAFVLSLERLESLLPFQHVRKQWNTGYREATPEPFERQHQVFETSPQVGVARI